MLKKSALLALTGLAVLCAVAAHAEEAAKAAATPDITTTGNLTFATNYVFRGLSQTNFKPAVQGTYEAAHSSGLYLGLFGSNVSWYADAWEEAAPGRNSNTFGGVTGQNVGISNSLELDLYAGYRGKAGDFTYDLGGIYYYYPGKYEIAANRTAFGAVKPNTGELYAAVGWQWIGAKVSYVVTDGVFGVSDARGTYYTELNATYPIADTGFNLIGHVGYWKFSGGMQAWTAGGRDNSVYDLTDYKLGVTKDYVGLSWGVFYTGSTADSTATVTSQADPLAVWGNRYGKNVGDNSLFLTVTKAF